LSHGFQDIKQNLKVFLALSLIHHVNVLQAARRQMIAVEDCNFANARMESYDGSKTSIESIT
jgi:hypothetical protein